MVGSRKQFPLLYSVTIQSGSPCFIFCFIVILLRAWSNWPSLLRYPCPCIVLFIVFYSHFLLCLCILVVIGQS